MAGGVIAATGMSAITSARVPARSPAIASQIAAASARNVNSIATNARKNGAKRERAARAAPARPRRGAATAAVSSAGGSPASARAT